MKLAIVIQYHSADRDNAMRLARMIADAEKEPRDDVGLVFCRDHKADPPDDYSLKKFTNQLSLASTSTWTGWPAGPNGLTGFALAALAPEVARIPTVLLLEPDCVITSRYWINHLMFAWGMRRENVLQMGAWRPSGGDYGHINGCCLLDLMCWPNIKDCFNQHLAWDCAIAPYMHNHWQDTPLIANLFQTASISEEELRKHDGAVIIHGVKSDQAYDYAMRKMGL